MSPKSIMDNVLDASGFVALSAVVPDILQEIRYHSTFNFVGARIDGYDEPVALMTREAAIALRSASDEAISRGYRIKIYDSYRPRRAVRHFERWLTDAEDLRMKPIFYPEMEKSRLIEEEFIARYSGHCRGSTLDCTLVEMSSGRDADMGGPFDFFSERSYSAYTGDLTRLQRANRALLREIMLNNGFRGIQSEWWHFTLMNEPYPNMYFDFPVSLASLECGRKYEK
ncbi:MAG: M15 family metallopeptidase [Clostridia bacterium]|nr:M15 family metallopeptidase [Clostridia bacterium]